MRAKERRVQLEEEDAEGGGEAIEEEEKGNWMERERKREREREREKPEEEALGGTLLGVRILGVSYHRKYHNTITIHRNTKHNCANVYVKY